MSFTGNFKLMFLNARGGPFGGKVDVRLKHTVLARNFTRNNFPGENMLQINDLESTGDGRYRVEVSAPRHRASIQHLQVLEGGSSVHVFKLAIDPGDVKRVKFPKFIDLPDESKLLLQNSNVEGFDGKQGAGLYNAFDDMRKAGLLNILAKMRATTFPTGRTVASFMSSLTRSRGDRFIAKVGVALRDEVKNSIPTGIFHEVSPALHDPPPGYAQADSFKTHENYGNLQLTFFRKEDALDFLVDADLDDAQGIEHIFQVLGHALTNGETHPYDIHQILLAHHGIDPGYELMV
ncbi:MAG TPA: hypothetical protein VJZ77_20690 [Blastocatellia bacterium]|nr:hypothetical protein [Blastocatellia bacterium]